MVLAILEKSVQIFYYLYIHKSELHAWDEGPSIFLCQVFHITYICIIIIIIIYNNYNYIYVYYIIIIINNNNKLIHTTLAIYKTHYS